MICIKCGRKVKKTINDKCEQCYYADHEVMAEACESAEREVTRVGPQRWDSDEELDNNTT